MVGKRTKLDGGQVDGANDISKRIKEGASRITWDRKGARCDAKLVVLPKPPRASSIEHRAEGGGFGHG